MEINLKNIEEQFFFNSKVGELLPEFRHLFDQWQMSKRYPGFGNLGQRSVVELLNSLEIKHLSILEEYFGEPILLSKIDPNMVKHYECDLLDSNLCKFSGYKEFTITRDKHKMKMTFWR